MSAGLVEFLRAQLAKDEQLAREAQEQTAARWRAYFKQVIAPGSRFEVEFADTNSSEAAAHFARHDPARVLAEVASKRRIVTDYSETVRIRDEAAARIRDAGGPASAAPEDLDTWDRAQREASTLEGPVKELALPYATEPGYREEWRP